MRTCCATDTAMGLDITPHIVSAQITRQTYINAINAMAANASSRIIGIKIQTTIGLFHEPDAKGGQLIPERSCNGETGHCQFEDYPGTV